MFTVTEKAQEQLANYFKENKVQPVRVFLAASCGGGQQIAMALDEVRPNDKTFVFAGVKYLVDRELLAQAQPMEIDFSESGFKVTSSLELESGCGGCGSSGACCS